MMYDTENTTTISGQENGLIKYNSDFNYNKVHKNNDHYKNFKPEGYKTIIGTYVTELKWFNIVMAALFHLIILRYIFVYPYLQEWTILPYGYVLGVIQTFGVTAGAHRLWCHRSYKAKLPLRIILMLCFAITGQNSIHQWVRDHRVHHKFSETDADPHNSKRGFFFAHMGWLLMKKHPEVLRRGQEVDMSDILADPVAEFHRKYFVPLKIIMCFIIPTIIPPLCWGQDWWWTFLGICIGRYILALHIVWLINSAAHIWGKKPYDKKIGPTENRYVILVGMGEGFHNYHHTFPWDYKAAELGNYTLNIMTLGIDLFAKIGWAYDLKSPSKELIKKVTEKHGDGSHPVWGHKEIPESVETNFTDNVYRDSNNVHHK